MNAPAKIATGLDLLRQPFPDHQISKLPKETRKQIDERKNNSSCVVWKCEVCGGAHHKNAVHLDYVGHAALTDRLLDADPHWFWEPAALNSEGLPAFDRTGGLWIKLTVLGITRLGYGCADGKSGGDAVKEIIGDALRNAAMRFGAALDLWHKGDLHLDGGESPEGQIHAGEVGPRETITTDQVTQLIPLIKAAKLPETKFAHTFGVGRVVDLPADRFDEALDRLNTRIGELVKAETNAKAKEVA